GARVAQAASAAGGLGYPVALKALSDDIPHKTELGLVATNLKTEDDLCHAFVQLSDRLAALDPQPPDCAFLVQEFIAGGIEVFAGVSRDPDFGLSLSFGIGGDALQVTARFWLRLLPLREGDPGASAGESSGARMAA